MTDFDVVIIGGGPVGLNLAAALENTGLNIAIVEQSSRESLQNPSCDGREIALTHASVRRLIDNGVWQHIPAGEIAPLRDAQVWNGGSSFHLQIDHRDSRCSELGFLVSNHRLRRAAFERLQGASAVTLVCDDRVKSITNTASGGEARATLESGRVLSASLIVAADTRFSATRRAVGIGATAIDFGRTMLVCRMQIEQPHHQVAHEWFDYGQTLAVLPLHEHCASVVLTVSHAEAERLSATSEQLFNMEMQRRFRHRWGSMTLIGGRFTYPLVGVYAHRFVTHRYALVGDAAVGMHPVTAHGFNLGLQGVETLARKIAIAADRGQDIGAPELLERYEQAHRRATIPIYLGTNALVRLYTAEAPPLRMARHALLRLAQRVTPVRRALAASLTNVG